MNRQLIIAVKAMLRHNKAKMEDIAYELGLFVEEMEFFLENPDHPAIETDPFLAECFMDKSRSVLGSHLQLVDKVHPHPKALFAY